MIQSLTYVIRYGAVAVTVAILLSSCRAISPVPPRFLSDPLDHVFQAIQSQPDPDLVREGFPTFLLLIDGLIHAAPEDCDYLLAGASAYGMYCQAFYSDDEQRDRAALLYDHANQYGLRLLAKTLRVSDARTVDLQEFERRVHAAGIKDVPALYTTASVWLGWILANADSMDAMSDLPRTVAIMSRVIELDEAFQDGAAHIFFGVYYAVQPRGAGQDLERSLHHFNRAIELAGENNTMPMVMMAEFYATATLDESMYINTLNRVVALDLRKRPEKRLLNEIYRRRAQHLLDNADDYL